MKELKFYISKFARNSRCGFGSARMRDAERTRIGWRDTDGTGTNDSLECGSSRNQHFLRAALTIFMLALTQYASNAQPAKDLLRGPLGFSMQEADKLLEGRSWAVTSPHLDNTESFHFGLGKAKTGLMWGDCSVSFETSTAFTLSVTHDSKMDEGATRLTVMGLRWDEEEQLYKGQATYYGKTHRDCGLKIMPMRNVKVRIWGTHPFQGALHSISGDLTDVYENEDCEFLRSEESSAGYVRTFTTVETIRAIEQVQSLWDGKVGPVNDELSKRRRLLSDVADGAYKEDMEKGLVRLEGDLRKRHDAIADVNWALKFGGIVRQLDGKEERYEHRKGLEAVNAALLNLTGQLMGEALILPDLAKSLKDQNDALETVLTKGGIGISMQKSADGISVSQMMAGSPAETAGLRSGDTIKAIDGRQTTGMSAEDAATLIRGPADSTVELSIATGEGKVIKTVTLTRKRLNKNNGR